MNTLTPDSGVSPQSGKLDFEPIANQGFRSAEIALSGNRRSFAFQQINEATIKVTDGRGTNAWSGNRGGGFRTTRAVAWLMAIGGGLWVCRYRNKASRPMRQRAARQYVVEMIKGIRTGKILADPIRHLHKLQVDLAEPMPTLAEVRAIETANNPPLTREAREQT